MGIVVVLILFVIVGGVLWLVTKLLNSNNVHKRGRYAYTRRVRMVFGGYLAILIVSLLLNTLLPVKGLNQLEKVDRKELTSEGIVLYDDALAGQVDEKFLREKWNFDYKGEKLSIASSTATYQSAPIVVERKEQNDGKIEAGFYMTKSSMNGLDITQYVQLPELDLIRDKLLLSNSPINEIRFSQFTNVFAVRQFTGDRLFSHNSTFEEGQWIFYLKVPKDLKLETSGLSLQYVGG